MAALLLAADVAARAYTEARMQRAVDQYSPADLDVHVHIKSFPFLGRLLAAGDVSEIDANGNDVHEGLVTFHTMAMELHDVRIDRMKLLAHRKVVLSGTGRGTARAELTAANLSDLLHVPVDIADGGIQTHVAGRLVRAEVSVVNGTLSLRVAGLSVPSIKLPDTGLLPCQPGAMVAEDHLVLSCSVDHVPPRLVELVNGFAAQ